MIQLKIGVIK